MRTKIQMLIIVLFAAAGMYTLQAQPGGAWNQTPEERANWQTTNMTQQLGLSDAQVAKVKDINLKYAAKMKEARDNANGDRNAMRTTMGAMRTEQDKELQTVMTTEQWQKWVTFRDTQRANRGNAGPGNAPGANQPGQAPAKGSKKLKKNKNKNKTPGSGSNQ